MQNLLQTTMDTYRPTEYAQTEADDPLPLLAQYNQRLEVNRLSAHADRYPELKDPSIVSLPDGKYMMFASVGTSITQEWIVGRFISRHPSGPWQEIEPVIFENLSGPQLCAPAVTYEEVNGQPLWKMYIQTACFEANGIIALATSTDGRVFVGQSHPLATRETIVAEHKSSVIGVYDVGVSEVKNGEEDLVCMLFSGYRRVGCGDLYVSYRRKSEPEESWTAAQRLLAQEEVPFHNHPEYEHFEWGLEGAKLVQLADECFLLIGVCFQPKPLGHEGTRQRVFFAAATSINGPFVPLETPFVPYAQAGRNGENGHPDTLVEGDSLWIIYQERDGNGMPWYLRSAKFNLHEMRSYFERALKNGHESMSMNQSWVQNQFQPETTSELVA